MYLEPATSVRALHHFLIAALPEDLHNDTRDVCHIPSGFYTILRTHLTLLWFQVSDHPV